MGRDRVGAWLSLVFGAAFLAATMFAVATISPRPTAASAPATTLLFLDGTTGDSITNGVPRTIVAPTEGTIEGNISAAATGPGAGLLFAIWPTDQNEDGAFWFVEFGAPPGQTLTPGSYLASQADPAMSGIAFFRLTGNSRGCTSTAATFDILEATYDAAGKPTSFAARFSQTCGDTLRGELRLESTVEVVARDIVPLSATVPDTLVGLSSSPARFTVTNTGTAPLHPMTPVVTGAVEIATDGCGGSTMAPGASCFVDVVLVPTAGGAQHGTITLRDDSVVPEHLIRVTGNGIAPTTTGLVSSVNPSVYPTQPTTYTAVVTPTPDRGSVQFVVDGVVMNTAFLQAGVATWVNAPQTGPRQVVATFTGRPYWLASQSAPVTQEARRLREVRVWATPIQAPTGHPVGIGAGLGSSPAGGTLTLVDELTGTNYGTVNQPGPSILQCIIRPGPGVHRIRATYSGFGDELPNTAYVDVTISAAAPVIRGVITTDLNAGETFCGDLRTADGKSTVTTAVVTLTARATGLHDYQAVRISNVDTVDRVGLLSKGRTFDYSQPFSWSLIDPAVGGQDLNGQVLVWWQLQTVDGVWGPLLLTPFQLMRADTVAPVGSVAIAGGASMTRLTNVTVSVPATDAESGLNQVALSNDGVVWTTRPYAATQPWVLASSNGTRTFYAKWQDAAGNWSAAKSDTIVLDTNGPTGTISIAGGAASTRLAAVSLSVAATDAVTALSQVALSNDGTTWTTRPYGATQSWTLPATNGTRTVYAKWKDAAGNWSAVKSDTIVLDTVAPALTAPTWRIGAAGTALVGGAMPVRIAWTGTDATSGIARHSLSVQVDGGTWTAISTSLTSPAMTRNLAPGHTYRFAVRAIDIAGNISPWLYGPTFRLTGLQQTATAVTYRGTWATSTSTTWWGGTAKASSAAGATAKATFTGRQFTWIGLKAANRGKAQVFVNGVLTATVDLYNATQQGQRVVWGGAWGTSATRTITIKVLGTAGRPRVDVDGFFVGN